MSLATKGDWVLIAVQSSYTAASTMAASRYVSWRVAKAAVVRNGLVTKVDTGGRKPEAVAGDLRTIKAPTPEQTRRLALAMDKPVYFASLDAAKFALTGDTTAIDDAKVYATIYLEDIQTNPTRKAKRNPRSPGRRGGRSQFKPPYSIQEWAERDRQHVELQDALGATIVEWWDDDVTQAVEDGFLEPRNLLKSATEYARTVGLIP